jgi:hypothetical protein
VALATPGEVREAATIADERGVLSFYIDASPERLSQDWSLSKRLRSELEHLAGATPALQRALPRLQSALDDHLEVTEGHGRGRALVAALGDGELRVLALPDAVTDTMTVDRRAIALPLVAALPSLIRAGVVTVSRGGVRILEVVAGHAEELHASAIEPAVDIDGNEGRPGGPRSTSEAYARAVEDDVARGVRAQTAVLRDLALRRHWQTVVVVGDPRVRHLVTGHADLRARILADDRDLGSVAPSAVAEAVEPHLAAERAEHDRTLLQKAKDGAGASGHGVLGLNDAGAALFAGRVSHLLLGQGRLPEAAVAPGGRIVDRAHPAADVAGEDLQPVDRTAEELARRALDTDAEVTCLEHGELADALGTLGGVAATLRW